MGGGLARITVKGPFCNQRMQTHADSCIWAGRRWLAQVIRSKSQHICSVRGASSSA
jgi:hypothetical protein